MGRLAGYRYRDIIKRLKELGLRFHRQAAGSHEIWFNESLCRYTTIPNHPGDMPEGTLRAILRQAGVEVNQFLDEEPEKQEDAAAQEPPAANDPTGPM